MNIRLNYLYRDAANYKTYGTVVFKGGDFQSLTNAETELEKSLIESEYFVAIDVAVPDLRPAILDCTVDHDWHEVEGLEECTDSANDQLDRTISEFIEAVGYANSLQVGRWR